MEIITISADLSFNFFFTFMVYISLVLTPFYTIATFLK